jgi:hypothetical protein
MFILSALYLFFRSLIKSRIMLTTEILALRQQLVVLNRTVKRPQLRRRDRFFWVALSKLWKDLARSIDHRQTQYSHQMAPARFPSLLALEIEGADWTSED